MARFNDCTFVGNLTADPDVRVAKSGVNVVNLRIAVNNRRKVDGDWKEVPMFIGVVCFSGLAEVASKYLRKGSSVLVNGELELDSWEDADNKKRSVHRLICNQMQLLDKKGEVLQNEEKVSGLEKTDDPIEEQSSVDNIPF